MKYWLAYIILSIGILGACSDVRVNMKDFPKSKRLVAEKIPINEIFSPVFVTKCGNYFVISSSLSDTTLFFMRYLLLHLERLQELEEME